MTREAEDIIAVRQTVQLLKHKMLEMTSRIEDSHHIPNDALGDELVEVIGQLYEELVLSTEREEGLRIDLDKVQGDLDEALDVFQRPELLSVLQRLVA